MLGRDRLTVALWAVAAIAAVPAVVLTGKPEHLATVIGVAALTARSGRTRCLDRRRARRQRRADAVVLSSADHIRALARDVTAQQNRQALQIEALYTYLAGRRQGDAAGSRGRPGAAGKLRLVTGAEDEAG